MKYLFLLSGFLFMVTSIGVPAQHGRKQNDTRSPFRYVIVSDVTELQKRVNDNPHYWELEVLMEDKAFNEKNLNELFTLLSKRFSARPGLFVNVFASMEALQTPEEYDRAILWGLKENYRDYKYAIFSRNGYGERFTYGIPGLVEHKEVTIKPAPAVWPPK